MIEWSKENEKCVKTMLRITVKHILYSMLMRKEL